MDWDVLGWIGIDSDGLGWSGSVMAVKALGDALGDGLGWIRMDWDALGWIWMHWDCLGWIGMD